MAVDRSGLSRRVRRDDYALAEFGVPKPNPYASADARGLAVKPNVPARNSMNRLSFPSAADAGSLDTTNRFSYGVYGVSPSYDGRGLAGAIQDLSARYPSGLTQDDVNQVMAEGFGDVWNSLYDPVTGNTAQAKFQAAGGGEDGLIAALGLDEGNLPLGDDDVTSRVTSGGGGGGSGAGGVDPVAYAQAINDYIASVEGGGTDFDTLRNDLTGRYAGYGSNLASIADTAVGRQDASAARAAEALAAIDPQTAFQFNVDPSTIGGGAAENYLRSIGASTAGVEGLRGFEQSLLNQALTGAQQFSAAQQSALDNERAARQAAVVQMGQEARNALDAQRMAYEMGLSESERVALEALLGRQSTEQQSIAEKILNARLMAAKSGVTL